MEKVCKMKRKIFTDIFNVSMDRENVLFKINCSEDSPVYDEVIETYNQLLPWFMNQCAPHGCCGMGESMSVFGGYPPGA